MDITIQTPNGPLNVSGSQAAVAWALMNLPEGKTAKAPAAAASPGRRGSRRRFSNDEKSSILKEALESGNMSKYAKAKGINYATLMSWKASHTGRKKKG
ncbi:MAG TPA: transposase [Polyangia bacterium]|jgi:hypothetical protein|nr:transposase [Polyangia bacterium]